MSTLSGPELEAARDALISGYFSWSRIEQLAAFALDINLEAEVERGRLKDVVWELLKTTEASGQTQTLLREAVARQPGNPKLAAKFAIRAKPVCNAISTVTTFSDFTSPVRNVTSLIE